MLQSANDSGIGTMNIAGSRRSGQRFIKGSQTSQRSGSENRSSNQQNATFQNSGAPYGNHGGSRETQDLNFMGSAA